MNAQRMITTIARVLLFSTAVFAQQVKTDYDRAADFGQ
jgi:hypothetical protein